MNDRKNLRIEADVLLVGSQTINTALKKNVFVDMHRLVQDLKARNVELLTSEMIEEAVTAFFENEIRTLDKVKLTYGSKKVTTTSYYPGGCINITPNILDLILQSQGVQYASVDSIESQAQALLQGETPVPARRGRRSRREQATA